ncbi:tetratricopeptide repeat protein [uncultured Sanguibacteroides sp.]|uniref:tetratricopeptide repeat protein n=1 Tax=uncultured Sanguibacteroides sp. TaxID=1635151 RepID=UPI0025FD1236|nr:tetratricopeptide repeat protein [uncultured Sanguibacteroides sp.]
MELNNISVAEIVWGILCFLGLSGLLWLGKYLLKFWFFVRATNKVGLKKIFEIANIAEAGRPHNLPHKPTIIGRKVQVKNLKHKLITSQEHIISIVGVGGIGKTTLTCCALHQLVSQNKFNKIIWIDGKNGNVDMNIIYDTIIDVFGKSEWLKLSLDEKKVKINNELFPNNKCLIVFDNYETIHDPAVDSFIRNILEPNKILITSRHGKFEETGIIKLEGLSLPETLKLLKEEKLELDLKEQTIKNNIQKLHQLTGGSPFALKNICGQIRNGANIYNILHYLEQAQGEIHDFIFRYSFDNLGDNEKKIASLLSLHSYPLDREVIIQTLKIEPHIFNQCIKNLSEFSLIDIIHLDKINLITKYRCHELTKRYFKSKLTPKDNESLNSAITQTYINIIQKDLSERIDNYDFIKHELYNILEACNKAFTTDWEAGKNLLLSIKWYLWETGLWDLRNKTYITCYHANSSISLNDRIVLLTDIAWVFFRQKDEVNFKKWFVELTEKEIKNLPNETLGTYFSVLGMSMKRKGERKKSEEYLLRSLTYLPETSHNLLERMRILTYIGELHRGYDNKKANDYFQQTYILATKNNYTAGICWSLQNIATIEIYNGQHQQAILSLKRGLKIAEKIHRTHTIAECKSLLAQLYQQKNFIQRLKAKKIEQEALAMFETLGLKEYEINNIHE